MASKEVQVACIKWQMIVEPRGLPGIQFTMFAAGHLGASAVTCEMANVDRDQMLRRLLPQTATAAQWRANSGGTNPKGGQRASVVAAVLAAAAAAAHPSSTSCLIACSGCRAVVVAAVIAAAVADGGGDNDDGASVMPARPSDP
jgi:hypothetical protein